MAVQIVQIVVHGAVVEARCPRGGARRGADVGQSVLAVLFAEVAAVPDTGADPERSDADDHDDDEDDPLVVCGDPDDER